ncbi:MAG: dTDP-glucose 4,6-dehydratase [Candidatus Thorarchaeota archaeon]
MSLLVTGCAGFIGSNFVYYFLEKNRHQQIIGLDKLTYAGNLSNLTNLEEHEQKRFQFVHGDICDRELVNGLFTEYEVSKVINFAAESHVDRSLYHPQVFLTTNVLGTHTLLDVASEHWLREDLNNEGHLFLQVSTDEVYGSLGPTGCFTETSTLDPRSPYSASKASADLVVTAYFKTFSLPTCITRCSNNYGPYQFPEKLIPLMIHKAMKHESLPVYGDGMQIRDWLHVKDHCSALELILQNPPESKVYNIGGNNERTNLSVVKSIIELVRDLNQDPEVDESYIEFVKDRPGHDRRYAIDATKIRTELGWAPKISFEDGLKETVQWYIDNQKWIESVISGGYLEFYDTHYGDLRGM